MIIELEKMSLKKIRKSERCFFDEKEKILILGICFYKNKLLTKITNLNATYIEDKLKEFEGNFAIIYFKENKWKIFLDYGGEIALYYYLEKEKLCISNLYYNILKKNNFLNINKKAFTESLSHSRAVTSRETVIENIYRFKGGELYTFYYDSNLEQICLSSEIVKKMKRIQNWEHFNLVNTLQEKAMFIKENFSKVAICMTGGSDSRLILALFLSVGIKPTLLYGIGDSVLTNTREEDYRIVKALATKFNLELKIMNWKDSFETEKEIKELLEEYGEEFFIYGANKNVFNEYKRISQEYDFIEFGYFGETLRNLEIIDEEFLSKKRKIDFNELCNIYIDLFIIKENKKKEYLEYIMKGIKNIIEKRIRVNVFGFTEEDFQMFHTEYRYLSDTAMLNFVNKFTNSMSVLSLFDVQEIISSIPVSQKKYYSYMLEVIKKLYPSALDIPFYSHCQVKEYNIEQNSLIAKKTLYNYLKNFKNRFLNNDFGESLKYIVFKFLFKEEKSRKELLSFSEQKDYYLQYCKKNKKNYLDFLDLKKNRKIFTSFKKFIFILVYVQYNR